MASNDANPTWKKRLSKIMTWTATNPDTGKPVQMPPAQEIDEKEDRLSEEEAAKLPTLEEQMEDEDRGFQEGLSAYSVTHLKPDVLNNVACMLPENDEALVNCFIVWPCEMSKVTTKEDLMQLTDRKYNGVAMNVETGKFVFFRSYFIEQDAYAHTFPLDVQHKLFDWALSDPVRQTILDSKNTRVVECVVPYKCGGTTIKAKLPYIPEDLYKVLVKEEATRKRKETMALKRKLKKEAEEKEKEEDEEAAPEEDKKRKVVALPKGKKKAIKKEEEDEGEDDGEADGGQEEEEEAQAEKKQKTAEGGKKVPPKAAKVLEEASAKTGSRKRASPAADKGEENARVEFRDGGWFIPRLAPRLLTNNAPVPTLPQILAHLEAKAAAGFRFANPFAGKRTMGGVMKDEHCVYAINGNAVVLQQFAPEMLGLAQQMPIPKDIAQGSLKKLL